MPLSPRVITVPVGFGAAFQFGAFNCQAPGPPTFGADFGNVTTSLLKQKGLPQNTLYKRIYISGDLNGLGTTPGNGFPKSDLANVVTLAAARWSSMNWGDDAALTWSSSSGMYSFTNSGFGAGGGDWASWWAWTPSNTVGPGSFDPTQSGLIAIIQRFYFQRPTVLRLWRITFGNGDAAQIGNPFTIMSETGTVTYGTDQALISTATVSGDTLITFPATETPTTLTPADSTDDQLWSTGFGQVGVGYYVDLGQS